MINAVIFDCFGVLVTDGWHPFKHKYFGDDAIKDTEASRLNDLTNKGMLGYPEFLRLVGELAGLSSQQVQTELNRNAPNEQLFEYISELKPDYKIGVLSNAADNWMDVLFTKEQTELFDEVVLSCDIGINKPNKRAYEITAEKLGCDVSECLFIDDIESYTEAAKQAGMHAIHCTSSVQTIEEIQRFIA